MMASSVKDGDAIVDLLLAKGADVNLQSMVTSPYLHVVASVRLTRDR